MPVTSLLKFLFDDISDQKDLTSAKEIRDDKGCQGWYKNHRDPADDTGTLRGRMILKKSAYYLHQDLLRHKVRRGQFLQVHCKLAGS